MRDKDEAAIEKALTALGQVTPPEGMEDRVNQRLRYAAAQANAGPLPIRDAAKTWWLGVLTGAAVATLVCAVCWFGLRGRTEHLMANNVPAADHGPRVVGVANRPVEAQTSSPCVQPAVRRGAHRAKAPALMRTATEIPKPAPPARDELTPQERELVRLAQVADPQDLSAMTSEARARADAQQAAAFQKFFTPPPPPPHDEGVNE